MGGLTLVSKIGQAAVVLLGRALRYIGVTILTYIGTMIAWYTKGENDCNDCNERYACRCGGWINLRQS